MSAVHLCGVFQVSAEIVKTQICRNLLKVQVQLQVLNLTLTLSWILFSLIPLMKTTQIWEWMGELELKSCIFIGWLLLVSVRMRFQRGFFFQQSLIDEKSWVKDNQESH